MPTVFERIKLYCNSNNLPLPSRDAKIIIGKEIAAYYVNNKQLFPFPLRRKQQVEDTGTFTVISYPKSFLTTMDSIVCNHLKQVALPPILVSKPKRKRIALNLSLKPQTNINAS